MNAILEKYRAGLDKNTYPYESFIPFADLGGIKELEDDQKAEIIADAEKKLGEEYPQLLASVYMQFKRDGNRSVYEGVCFKRRSMLGSLLFAELIERKGRFTDKLIDGIWLLLEETTWIIPAHDPSRPGHNDPLTYEYARNTDYIDLFSAETGAVLAWIWYLSADILDAQTTIIRERILYELRRRIIEPFMNYDTAWWMGFAGNTLNNWTPWIISNVLTVCALCEKDHDLRVKLIDRSIVILDKFTGFYKSDGGCDEGAGYWGVAGASYFDCLELLYDMCGIDAFGEPLVRAMGEYIPKVNIKGNKYINFADCHASASPDMTLLYRFGRRCASDMMIGLAAAELKGKSRVCSANLFGQSYRSVKNLYTRPEGDTYYKYDRKVWLDGIQVLALRENEDGSGIFLGAKAGFNSESHNHNDVGSFIVYYNGEPLFIDIGVGTYSADTFNQNRYKIWTMQSQFHNIPTINGKLQPPGGEYRASDVVFDDKSGRLKMSLKNAYPKDSGIEKYNRVFALDDGTVLITDDIKLSGSGNVVFNFMTADKPSLEEKGVVRLSGGHIAGYDQTLCAELDEIELTDKVIIRDWKREKLYRIRLTTPAGFTSGSFKFTVK